MMREEVKQLIAESIDELDLIEWVNLYSALKKYPEATSSQIKELISRDSKRSALGGGIKFEEMVAAGGIGIKMMRGNKGDGFKNHSHDYDHITLVAKGSVMFHRGDGELKHFGVGVVVTEKNVEHEYLCAEDDTVLACIHRIEQLDERGNEYLLVEDKHTIGKFKDA